MAQGVDRRFPPNSEQLFVENLGLVYHLVSEFMASCGNHIDQTLVEDAAMAAYINAIRLFKIDGGAKFSTYAYTAIKNGILGELERQIRGNSMLAEETRHLTATYSAVRRPTEEIALNHIFWELFHNVGLTPREGEVMILHVLHGMTFEEIAEIHGNSRQANFNALIRAREKLSNNALIVGYAEET